MLFGSGRAVVVALVVGHVAALVSVSDPAPAKSCREDAAEPRVCEQLCHDGVCELRATIILPEDSQIYASLSRVLPVLELAHQDVRQQGLIPDWLNIKWYPRNDHCHTSRATIAAMDGFDNCSHVIFGPICEYGLATVGRVVKYFGYTGTPLITTGGLSFDFQDPKQSCEHDFYMNVRVGSLAFKHFSEFLHSLIVRFEWNKLVLIYESDGQFAIAGNHTCYLMMKTLVEDLRTIPEFFFHQIKLDLMNGTMKDILQTNVGTNYGVIIQCVSPMTVRKILLAASDLNMTKSGEYIFLNLDLESSFKSSNQPQLWYKPNDTKENNEKARAAYQALLNLKGELPDGIGIEEFSERVHNLTIEKTNSSLENRLVTISEATFYDGFMLYALAVNESIGNDIDIWGNTTLTGYAVAKQMCNRSFEGITGLVEIDGNCDRINSNAYNLFNMNPSTHEFEVVAKYYPATSKLIFIENQTIHWPGDAKSAPLANPKCGYDMSKCPDTSLSPTSILMFVLSVMVVLTLVLCFFVYRYYKIEASIASMTWKIRWESIQEISVFNSEVQGSQYSVLKRADSINTMFSAGNISVEQHTRVPAYRYKGLLVNIKYLPGPKPEMNRSLLLELKRMKDIQHNHLVRFYGACLDFPHLCLITEYCPRGSLLDLCSANQFKMDWMIQLSLMHDITLGMCYLHNSEIKSHGSLKSSNCVVDSRFVLKITDFGLHQLRRRNYPSGSSDEDLSEGLEKLGDDFWRGKLWTAPELLRMVNPPPQGTQKGDVYSFAIIIHEIVFRQGPFYIRGCENFPVKSKLFTPGMG